MTFFVNMCGPRGVGKDHVGNLLFAYLNNIGISTSSLSLAEPIKQMASEITGLGVGSIESLKRNPESGVRQLLIDIGLAGRRYSPDSWVEALRRRAELKGTEVCIVTDVRFPNEIEELPGLNVALWTKDYVSHGNIDQSEAMSDQLNVSAQRGEWKEGFYYLESVRDDSINETVANLGEYIRKSIRQR